MDVRREIVLPAAGRFAGSFEKLVSPTVLFEHFDHLHTENSVIEKQASDVSVTLVLNEKTSVTSLVGETYLRD